MTVKPLVLDHTALVALFAAEPDVYRLLERANDGASRLLFPTTAIAEAEAYLKAGIRGWDAILITPNVFSLPLTEHASIEIGARLGALSVRHVVHEAQAAQGVVVTSAPAIYRDEPVTVLAI